MIVTVTLNAAVDRTLTVPNFQFGHRHRASSRLTGAGGKGINVARALKRLDTPVVATGLAGGRTGDRIVEDLGLEGILSDFVRISDESRTSIAVVDPTAGALTEVYEWGPAVRPDELQMLSDKLHYLSRVASYVVFCGSLPRDVENDWYADAIHDLTRRGIKCVLDCEGEPLRVGVEAEPYLVTPNQQEAESLVGQEFMDEEDFVMALDTIADLGARNVLITQETACFALVREERQVQRFRASIPRVEPIAPVGAGDVLLGGYLSERFNGRSVGDALRTAVGCAAASVVELGAGRFDPREAARLAARGRGRRARSGRGLSSRVLRTRSLGEGTPPPGERGLPAAPCCFALEALPGGRLVFVRSRAAEAGASAVRPAAKSPLRGCLSLQPFTQRWLRRFEPAFATKQASEARSPNVHSARSQRETALSRWRSSFKTGRRAKLFARLNRPRGRGDGRRGCGSPPR